MVFPAVALDILLWIVAKENTHLNFHRIEGRDALHPVFAEEFAGLYEFSINSLEDDEAFVCRIEYPIKGHVLNFKGTFEIAGILAESGYGNLADPIGTVTDRVVKGAFWNSFTPPSHNIV
jgi:hypothetical protein